MATRARRRLPSEDRREQLENAALAVAARQGFADLSLEAVAAEADVTRSLLYHYFPRGRADLQLAAARRSGAELADGWVTDPEVAREERMASNFGRMLDHAFAPSPAWSVYRQARTSADPEVRRAGDTYRDLVAESIALNNTGDADPAPLLRAAIFGFLAFGEEMVEEARARDLPRDQVLAVLAGTLQAAIAGATT